MKAATLFSGIGAPECASSWPVTRPLVLDLFCGAGGASMGLYRAGFDVIGIDIKRQPRYPFRFIQADALKPPVDLSRFDLIWASPPCQAYVRSGMVAKDGRHPRLIEPVRKMLRVSGAPWIIENVPGAPLRADLVLCGTMFGLGIRRHRLFEGEPALPPFVPATCDHGRPITGVYGHPHGRGGAWRNGRRPMLPGNAETWGREMGIAWMIPSELALAVPPAYAEFIGRWALRMFAEDARRREAFEASKKMRQWLKSPLDTYCANG
jgi:DNA (cytosine-5)-methyltransferase 1